MSDSQSASPTRVLKAPDVRDMLGAALTVLRQHRDEVDALNVFPVPDGDTGANMALTMQSAWKEIEGKTFDHAGAMFRAFAMGAIRGARGNSGVILSQILRGMSDVLGDSPEFKALTLARAFRQGQKIAYQGVMQPVEGTILTIIRAVADASEHAVALNDDIGFLFETSLNKARAVLAQTPDMLPVLKQAGVVDAGGQGLVYIIEGMTRYVQGETIPATQQAAPAPGPRPDLADLGDEWGYDIQYLIYNARPDEDAIRRKLIELGGESIVVGRSGSITKVHVHGEDPGPFLSYGASLGHLDDVVVENMTLQTLRRRGEWDDNGPVSTDAGQEEMTSGEHCSNVVAVAPGEGFARVFESLGACQVVTGGQTMNPSAEELLQALERVPKSEIIILPNNKNIIMAAHQAASLSDKKVFVVETRTLPQGVSAMFAFNPDLEAAENVRQMQAMIAHVHAIEVTTAVRDTQINGVEVSKNNAIAMVDGELCCTGAHPDEVAQQAIASLEEKEESDVITIYYGLPSSEEQAQNLARTLAERYPDKEIDVLSGGQPHYHYIISVE
jgi:DAK2 domain fusion protein YloV